MIAVRTNERAAAALGISVPSAKLYAFALSAFIAGLGGGLLGVARDNDFGGEYGPYQISTHTRARNGGAEPASIATLLPAFSTAAARSRSLRYGTIWGRL